MAIKSRRRKVVRRKVISKEVRERRQLNKEKLIALLANEKREEHKEISPLLAYAHNSIFTTVTRYANPVIEVFSSLVKKSSRMYAADFDPKVEYDDFIAQYVNRFGAPKKKNKTRKSRKGIGGRKEGGLSTTIRQLVKDRETNYQEIGKKTYFITYPGKVADPERNPLRWSAHMKKVRARLDRIAPHLLPKKKERTTKPK